MSDDHERDQPADEEAYEPPAVEPIGSAEELAKGNEGSATDNI
jgi:hypothetical protein